MVRETSPEPRGSTVDRLIEVGERLFAQHGLDGVSLRQIAAESGTSNNSAVRYHFGSKEALVTAIIEYRLPHIIQRRELLSARSDPDDLRSVLEAHLLPTVDMAESADNHYLIFIEQLQRYGRSSGPSVPAMSRHRCADSHRQVSADRRKSVAATCLNALRAERIGAVANLCLHASADRQRALHFGAPQRSYALHVNDLFDGLVGYLQRRLRRPPPCGA